MIVEFRCNSRCLTYKPGRVYKAELTPILKAVLDQDRHLSLIDPPTLDPQLAPQPEPQVADPPAPKPKPEPKLKLTTKIEEEKVEDDQEDVQNRRGAGTPRVRD